METSGNHDRAATRYSHLSEVHPDWAQVAPRHEEIEQLAAKVYSLPFEEFRKIPYKPPPVADNAPVPGKDILIRQDSAVVRDGEQITVRIYQPLHLSTNHLLFYNIHGGGWTVGTPETEETQNRLIAHKNNVVVVSVDYRKAPEFPFPYALNDSLDVLIWCRTHANSLGIDPDKIIIGGGSAGANVAWIQAAALAQVVREKEIPGIIGQILNIPVTCHPAHFPSSRYEYHSYEQNAGSPILSSARMQKFWGYYLPSAEADPKANPLLAKSFAGLPPALIQVAGMDPLRDEGLAYAEALKDNGVDVSLKIYPGLPHAFYVYPNMAVCADYFQSMVDWIENLSSGVSSGN
ncbi:lipase esterase family protein [Thozetella sp. PMI_491]|nr:lipase esterase family protein [Thozetella sp. PMI_491]